MPSDTDMDVIVSTGWLADHRDDPDLIIVDVRPEDQYAAGHIPGARNIDLYPLKILDSDPGMIADWVTSMEAAFRTLGVPQHAQVVFYEDISGTTAARGAWLMQALSIGEGAMLDGGLAAWMRAALPVSTDPVTPAPSSVNATLNPDLFATASDVQACSDDDSGTCTIIDTRGDLEWMQGTIQAARQMEWVRNLNADGTFRPAGELRAMYREFGLSPDDRAITFCASGYRAANTWVVLKWLGYDHVSNYAPSWGEWGRRADLPVAPTR